MEEYPILDISDQIIDDFESMGTKSKFWYTDSNDGQEYIFKSIHTLDKRGNPTVRHGENWSEKVACELAELLGIPHAHYDLAFNSGQHGTRSPNFIQTGENMVFGNQLLEKVATTLATPLGKGERAQRIEFITTILERIIVNPPKGWQPTACINNAFDVFLGYLMLDTLISNQDRHSQNWAMIEALDGTTYLAPSFDHGASLGRNERDEVRIERLTSKDSGRQIPQYVTKCKSHFYFHDKRRKTLEAFLVFSANSPDAALEWLERLESIDNSQIIEVVTAVPSEIMTDVAKIFCYSIIIANKARLLSNKELIERFKGLVKKRATQ